jgi:phosphoadenosine phosphosulfate reductase
MWDIVEHSKAIIKNAVNSYDKITLAVSWGKDSMVILHLAREIKPDIDLFTVLTPFKPKETFKFKDEVIELWNLNIKEFQSEEKVDPDLHKTDPDKCCEILKVKPIQRALEGYDAWITGLRNTEGRTRTDYKEIEDYQEIIKINPILQWTEAEVWKYMAVHKIPVHPWYGRGYRSLGCECCSTPGGESERDGRWKGTSKCGGECGIHTMYKRIDK